YPTRSASVLITGRPRAHTRLDGRPFTVCVPPLFGSPSDRKLLDFVEMSRALGAEHFVFYLTDEIYSNNGVLLKLLTSYASRGLATLFHWKPVLAVHHCLYWNMGLSKYAVFQDFDELLVPNSALNTSLGLTWLRTLMMATHCGFSRCTMAFDNGAGDLCSKYIADTELHFWRKQFEKLKLETVHALNSSSPRPTPGWWSLKGFAENWRPGCTGCGRFLHHLRRLLARVEVSCSSTEPATLMRQLLKASFANPEAASVPSSSGIRRRGFVTGQQLTAPARWTSTVLAASASWTPQPALWQLAAAENALTDEGDEFPGVCARRCFEEAGSRELADAWSVGLWHLGRRPLPEWPSWMDPGSMADSERD
uniref:Glycosyltransferase family 92 protein n=1 Tax=Macrostomum lignano TaxID=282301 RepID=A0A1I8FPB0_9PLAT